MTCALQDLAHPTYALTTNSDKPCCYAWFVCHDSTNQQCAACMLRLMHPVIWSISLVYYMGTFNLYIVVMSLSELHTNGTAMHMHVYAWMQPLTTNFKQPHWSISQKLNIHTVWKSMDDTSWKYTLCSTDQNRQACYSWIPLSHKPHPSETNRLLGRTESCWKT